MWFIGLAPLELFHGLAPPFGVPAESALRAAECLVWSPYGELPDWAAALAAKQWGCNLAGIECHRIIRSRSHVMDGASGQLLLLHHLD